MIAGNRKLAEILAQILCASIRIGRLRFVFLVCFIALESPNLQNKRLFFPFLSLTLIHCWISAIHYRDGSGNQRYHRTH